MATGPLLTTTGPERTLVEDFRRPALARGSPGADRLGAWVPRARSRTARRGTGST